LSTPDRAGARGSGERIGVRVRALGAAVAVALIGVAPAAGGVRTDDVGEDAWWYQSMELADVHRTSTGAGATVAVIDSQVDPTVPELAGQQVVPVRNFCGGSPTGTGAAAAHGTSIVVDIVGSGKGTAPGGIGVAGVAPQATVRTYAVEDATSTISDVNCAGIDEGAAVAGAIDAAVADGARIISTSLGGDDSPVLRAAVDKALRSGVVLVAAAGDGPLDSSVRYPAAYRGVVAVAAVDQSGDPWAGNVLLDRRAFVISAPGVDIATGSFEKGRWSSEVVLTGTSEAAPLVAGSLALVAAKYPAADGNQLIQTLIHNPAGDRDFGFDTDYGYGVVSPLKMLATDPRRYPDVNPLLPTIASPSPDPSARPVTSAPAPTAPAASGPAAAPGDIADLHLPVWLLPTGIAVVLASGYLARRWARRHD
jgi:subtilisin family serine protease